MMGLKCNFWGVNLKIFEKFLVFKFEFLEVRGQVSILDSYWNGPIASYHMANSRNFPHSLPELTSAPSLLSSLVRLWQGFVAVNGPSHLISLSFSSTKSIPLSSSLSISLQLASSLSLLQCGHAWSAAPRRHSIARAIQPCLEGDEMVDCSLPATGTSTLANGGACVGVAMALAKNSVLRRALVATLGPNMLNSLSLL